MVLINHFISEILSPPLHTHSSFLYNSSLLILLLESLHNLVECNTRLIVRIHAVYCDYRFRLAIHNNNFGLLVAANRYFMYFFSLLLRSPFMVENNNCLEKKKTNFYPYWTKIIYTRGAGNCKVYSMQALNWIESNPIFSIHRNNLKWALPWRENKTKMK